MYLQTDIQKWLKLSEYNRPYFIATKKILDEVKILSLKVQKRSEDIFEACIMVGLGVERIQDAGNKKH